MRSGERRIPVLILVIVGLVSFCEVAGAELPSGEPAEAESEPVRIGVLRGPTAVAFAPLLQEPATLPDGRPLELEIFPTPQVLLPRLISGELDGATIPSNVAAQLWNRGIPIQVSATFLWGVLYVIGSTDIDTLGDLASGSVHSPGRGATPDIVLRYLLDGSGLGESVEVVYGFDQVELAQLLIAGRISAAILPEPFATRVLMDSEANHVIADVQAEWRRSTGSSLPQTVLAMYESAGAATEVRMALAESVAGVLADPAHYAGVVEDLDIGLDAATTVEAIPRLNMGVVPGVDSQLALEGYFGILLQFDPAAIGGELPSESFYAY